MKDTSASNAPGLLITLEGGEGGGKTTQAVRVRESLLQKGKDVVVLREPGGTLVSEQIREVVLSPKNIGISFTAEVLLFQAARAQIYRELVAPSLKAGKVVVIDRSRDSSVVYQGMVRGFGVELIENLNSISTDNIYPDLTFLLDISIDEGLKRRRDSEEMDRIDMESDQFHQKVRDAYLSLAQKNDHGRWRIINGSQSKDKVHANIMAEIEELLKL